MVQIVWQVLKITTKEMTRREFKRILTKILRNLKQKWKSSFKRRKEVVQIDKLKHLEGDKIISLSRTGGILSR